MDMKPEFARHLLTITPALEVVAFLSLSINPATRNTTVQTRADRPRTPPSAPRTTPSARPLYQSGSVLSREMTGLLG
jgi:hypothetical protein